MGGPQLRSRIWDLTKQNGISVYSVELLYHVQMTEGFFFVPRSSCLSITKRLSPISSWAAKAHERPATSQYRGSSLAVLRTPSVDVDLNVSWITYREV